MNRHGSFHSKRLDRAYCHQLSHGEVNKYNRYMKVVPIVSIIINTIVLIYFIHAANSRNTIYFVGIILFMVLAKELLIYHFARRLSKKILDPLEKLKGAVNEVSTGNYGITVNEPSPENEVGQLIDAFNQMSTQLKESEELKKRYEINRKNLIANISHDLKTPITSIMGYVQGIQEGVAESPEKLNKYISIIRQNAIYTNKLINDLFLYSKLDIQQLEFDFIQTPVKAFMEDLMTELVLEFKEQDVDMEFTDLVASEIELKIDGKRIRQVILNVISNAIKYNDKEEVLITCSMTPIEDGVQINITDNGSGIAPDRVDTIFNRFYRVDESRGKDKGGAGLGLAISKELVKAHHGKIWANSRLDHGTTIHFTIHDQNL